MAANKVEAYIGLGGNIGDVIDAFRQALRTLDQHVQLEVTAVSPVYRTAPWGVEDQPWFHNACAALKTDINAQALLSECMGIEKAMARVRDKRWGPRTIDLDILVFGDQRIEIDGLTVPHPRIKERQFVLQPLSDIGPEVLIDGKTANHWLAQQDWDTLETVDLEENWWR